MKKDAIVTDASGKKTPGAPASGEEAVDQAGAAQPGAGGEEQAARPKSAREEAMDRLVQRRQEEVKAEAAEFGIPSTSATPAEDGDTPGGEEGKAAAEAGGEGEGEGAEAGADAAIDAAAEAAAGGDVLPLVNRDGKFYAKIKVNGQELEAPYQEIVARAQKNWAADIRLQHAAERERVLDEREQKLKEREAAAGKVPAAGAQSDSSQPSGATPAAEDLGTEVDEVVASLFQGDEEKARKSLTAILSRRPTATGPGVDAKAIVAAAVQEFRRQEEAKAVQSFETRRVEAVNTYQAEFPEIAADPVLSAAFNAETSKLIDADPNRNLIEIAREAGKTIRKRLGGPAGKTDTERLNRKREAGSVPAGVNRAAKTGQDEPPPKTRSQKIAEMRAARGQVV